MDKDRDVEVGNKKYLEGYQLILENAKNLVDAADLLMKKKKYGIANSLLIIAGEEIMKSYFSFVMYTDPESVIEEFEQSFRHHKVKLKSIGTALFWIRFSSLYTSKYFNPFVEYLEKTDENTDDKETEEVRHKYAQDFINSFGDKKAIKQSVKESKWWESNAQQEKENGMYVNKSNQGWSTPSQIHKAHYLKTQKFELKLLHLVEGLAHVIKNEDFFQKMAEVIRENGRKMRELRKMKP